MARSRTYIEHSVKGALFLLLKYQRNLSEPDERSGVGVYLRADNRQLNEDASYRIRQIMEECVTDCEQMGGY